MEEYRYYASSARKVAAAVWIALIALLGYACAGAGAQCGSEAPVDTVPCRNYEQCVDKVITALQNATPNKKDLSYTRIYPRGTFGGVTGSASCVLGTELQHCQECLVGAKAVLDGCKSYAAAGSFVGDVCTMTYAQFLPHE
ncbi:unnamed protein product [Linum tenue]|uniref:Gnk2-homologous domain-containing protein n=1 Tax=Linum tenue TaxID=586396 RepID=A0AAV0IXG0_9ROSI|nr:unnamed protein product [Linum tenue]